MFIGWPLVRKEKRYDPKALKDCLVDPRCPDEEWRDQTKERANRNYSKNRNIIRKVKEGSIVVVPRPNEGAAYLGRIQGSFEIVNTPSWAGNYLDLRMQQGLDVEDGKNHHVADVAQGWPVEKFVQIDLPLIPGWLRRSLLGRSTYGELKNGHPIDEDVTAYSVLVGLLERRHSASTHWSLDIEDVKKRLVDTLAGPNAFENLVVELLQLEHPEQIWHHTGGPGDGGIDGFGSNEAGNVVGLMQAKYYAEKAPDVRGSEESVRRYAAVLLPKNPEPTDGTCLLDLDWVANAVLRHWRRLPLALTLRVGDGPTEGVRDAWSD